MEKLEVNQILERPSFTIIGLALRTSNLSAAIDVPQFWERIFDSNILSHIPNKTSDDIYAVYTDYEGDHTSTYTLIIGCQVSTVEKVPNDMIAKIIPDATYAVYKAKGEFPQCVYDTWVKIWHEDLARTYTADFELYGEKYETDSEVDIYIAINK